MKIILVNGKKRSGKDWFASVLQERLDDQGYSSEIMAFADPIKNIISQSLGISEEALDKFKNTDEPISIKGKKVSNCRLILQKFGTEAMKEWFGEDVWVDLLLQRAQQLEVD